MKYSETVLEKRVISKKVIFLVIIGVLLFPAFVFVLLYWYFFAKRVTARIMSDKLEVSTGLFSVSREIKLELKGAVNSDHNKMHRIYFYSDKPSGLSDFYEVIDLNRNFYTLLKSEVSVDNMSSVEGSDSTIKSSFFGDKHKGYELSYIEIEEDKLRILSCAPKPALVLSGNTSIRFNIDKRLMSTYLNVFDKSSSSFMTGQSNDVC